jgi:hypothetical protein
MRSFHVPALFRQTSPRKRLWQLGGAVALIMLTILAMNPLLPREKRVTNKLLGHDFMAFYSAGSFAREHRFQDLYNLDAIRDSERAIASENHLEVGEGFGPWWNPPYYAWAFAPLAELQYADALRTWIVINSLATCAAIMLLVDMLPIGFDRLSRDWRTWALVPLLLITSMPLVQAISHGQNTCTSLLILCGTVKAWRARRAVIAGMLAGLLFYKPQLAAVLAVVMTISLGRRALLGMSFTGGILLLLTALTMPGMLGVYLRQLPLNVHFMQVEHAYLWERHVTLKALWRLLLMGRDAGEATIIVQVLTILSTLAFGASLLMAAIRSRRELDDPWTGQTSAAARDRLIAATIVVTPLLMPFYFDYDLLLLAVPAVLFAGQIVRNETLSSSDRWTIRTWITLGAWLMINPGLARMSHVNLSAILLAVLSVQLIARACRGRSLAVEDINEEAAQPVAASLRAAA